MGLELNRRKFLIGAAFITAGAVLSKEGVVIPPVAAAPNPFGAAEKFAQQPLIIARGVNIRDYPAIPGTPLLHIPGKRMLDNKLDWNEIETVNGVALNHSQFFQIDHAPIVQGFNTYRMDERDSIYDDWVRLTIKRFGQLQARHYFVNKSPNTTAFVRGIDDDYYVPTSKYQVIDGQIRLERGEPFDIQDMGKVSTYPGIDTLAELWQDRAAARLRGNIPLVYGYEKYSEVRVVPAGDTVFDWDRMRQENTPIEVRYLPPSFYRDGKSIPEVGFISLDTIIKNVVISQSAFSGIFFRSGVQGEVIDNDRKPISLSADKVLVMDEDFLLTTGRT